MLFAREYEYSIYIGINYDNMDGTCTAALSTTIPGIRILAELFVRRECCQIAGFLDLSDMDE